MKTIFHALYIFTLICLSSFIYGMEVIKQEASLLPDDALIQIAGWCRPREKNLIMKVCKFFNTCLKKRELVLVANPLTVSWRDKEKGMFTCADSGDAEKLSLWLHYLKLSEGYINATNSLGLTAFHVASENNHEDVMRVLVKYGAEVNRFKPAIQPLHEAIYRGNKKQVETLLALNVDPNFSLENGVTPLGIAIYEGHTEMVELLCTHGVNMDHDGFIFTPLYLASQFGYIEIVRFFMSKKVNVNKLSANKCAPLHIASQMGHAEIVRLLIEAQADINQVDNNGTTSLDIALRSGYTDIAKLFIDAGADVHYIDSFGYSPLDWAMQFRYDEIVSLLLSVGAKVLVTQPDISEPTPVKKSKKKGLQRMHSFYKNKYKNL